jgi:hypothetical protein
MLLKYNSNGFECKIRKTVRSAYSHVASESRAELTFPLALFALTNAPPTLSGPSSALHPSASTRARCAALRCAADYPTHTCGAVRAGPGWACAHHGRDRQCRCGPGRRACHLTCGSVSLSCAQSPLIVPACGEKPKVPHGEGIRPSASVYRAALLHAQCSAALTACCALL